MSDAGSTASNVVEQVEVAEKTGPLSVEDALEQVIKTALIVRWGSALASALTSESASASALNLPYVFCLTPPARRSCPWPSRVGQGP